MLHPVKMYHFDYACVCFVKDFEDDKFISRLNKLPIIFNNIVYDLTKMDKRGTSRIMWCNFMKYKSLISNK